MAAIIGNKFKGIINEHNYGLVFGTIIFLFIGLLSNNNLIENKIINVIFFGVASMIIMIYVMNDTANNYFRTKKGLLLIGNASFSIYLIHTFVLSASSKVLSKFHIGTYINDNIVFILISIISTIAGVLIHIYI